MREQRRLVDRLGGRFEPDERFRGLWLTGSFGQEVADRFSDVDTVLIVDETVFDSVVGSWDVVSAPLGPFLLRQQIPHTSVFNHVFPGWLRWDATLASTNAVPPLLSGRAKVVFDHDGRTPTPAPPARIDRAAVHAVTVEFLRCVALLPVVVGRGDTVTGVSGVELLRQLTIQLLRLVDEPGTPTGALHLRRSLSPEHYAALAALPPVGADLSSVIDGHRTLIDLFVPLAAATLGDEFPQAFAQGALERVATPSDRPPPSDGAPGPSLSEDQTSRASTKES